MSKNVGRADLPRHLVRRNLGVGGSLGEGGWLADRELTAFRRKKDIAENGSAAVYGSSSKKNGF